MASFSLPGHPADLLRRPKTHDNFSCSPLAQVHSGRVSCGSASGSEPFGLHGLAVARGSDSSTKGRSARRPRLSLPIPAISNLIFGRSKSRVMPNPLFGSTEFFKKKKTLFL